MTFLEDFLENFQPQEKYHEDLRTLRTKKFLAVALIKLLQKTSLENISVSDICNKAMVHRTTFYHHFNDKFDLFAFVLDEMQEYIFQKANGASSVLTNKDGFMQIAKIIVDFIDENSNMLIKIIKNNKSENVMNIFYSTLAHSIKNMLEQSEQQTHFKLPLDIISYYVTGGFTRLLIWWLYHKNKYSKTELLGFVDLLLDEKYYLA